jgi:hypothetical protein
MTTITLEGKEYQLDIEQAKKFGILKEKDSRVKSWDEFKEKYRNIKGYWFDKIQGKVTLSCGTIATCEQLTLHEAKALAAFSKLLKLRRDWIGEWEPDWTDYHDKFILYRSENEVRICTTCTTAGGLSFPIKQMARDFQETFHDLIEEAKILI